MIMINQLFMTKNLWKLEMMEKFVKWVQKTRSGEKLMIFKG